MKNVKNSNEIDRIHELINMNRFCLNNYLLDAKKLTGDRVNNLDIDTIENIITNKIKIIAIHEVKKYKMSYKLMQYLIDMYIYIDDDVYSIKNWFTYDKRNNYFEDAEVMSDNDYMM